MEDFTEKVVLVTGAGRGIGRVIAEAFAARGAIVALNDFVAINLEAVLESIHAAGGHGKYYAFDLAKKMPVQALIDQVVMDWGRLDVLINSASVEPKAPVLDMDEWDWHRTIDVNLGGPFLTIQSAGKVMREQGAGVIVNLAVVGEDVQEISSRAAYMASKMGLIGLTRVAAFELAAFGIRVHAVCSEALAPRDAQSLGQAAGGVHDLSGKSPLGRFGDPQNVADLVLFLCSDAAAANTSGKIIVVADQAMR